MRFFITAMLAVVALTFAGCGKKAEERAPEAGTEAHGHGEEVQGEHHEESQEGEHEEGQQEQGDIEVTVYVCPMHPEVTSSKRDHCSKCGMFLERRQERAPE